MKILIAGSWNFSIYEEALFNAFGKIGCHPLRFAWGEYFPRKSSDFHFIKTLNLKIQNKFIFGPVIKKINKDLVHAVNQTQPDMVFIFRGCHIYPNTIKEMRKRNQKMLIIGYNNDNPFSGKHPYWLWRYFIKSIPEYDVLFAYRHKNLEDFKKYGAKKVSLLRSWFIPELNCPIELSDGDKARFGCDVVFVGHFEKDNRLECLEEIAKNGFKLKIFGPGEQWNPVILKSKVLSYLYPVDVVEKEDYNKALCGSKIALCFFSKINQDTYTRRCFEIPATKTMMLSEYTDDMNSLFKDGLEAEYFRSKEEMLDKVKIYLKFEEKRERVALAGYNRLIRDGHGVSERVLEVLKVYNSHI